MPMAATAAINSPTRPRSKMLAMATDTISRLPMPLGVPGPSITRTATPGPPRSGCSMALEHLAGPFTITNRLTDAPVGNSVSGAPIWVDGRGLLLPITNEGVMLVQMDGAAYPVANAKPLSLPSLPQEPEAYTPPLEQHAGALLPVEIDSKKNAFLPADGLYLQVGAFANPDAAQLLRDKLSTLTSAPVFINSVVRNQQVLHRVRMGPVPNQNEAENLKDRVRLANLGQAALVSAE